MEEGEAIGEAFVEGDDDVLLVGVDVLETGDVEAEADEAGSEAGPPALGGSDGSSSRSMTRKPGGEVEDEVGGAEQDEGGGPGSEPVAPSSAAR